MDWNSPTTSYSTSRQTSAAAAEDTTDCFT